MRAQDWDRRWAERLAEPVREPNRFLIAEAVGLPASRALDLACGAGRNAVWLAEHGWQVTGVDFSSVALSAARELAAEHGVELELVEADVVDWSPPAEAFRLVCVMYLQLPEPERRAVLARATAALAPGGVVLVVAHDSLNLTEGYGGPSNQAVLCTADEVVADLAGLEVERAERVARPVETPEGERTATDLVVRARRPEPERA
jgi:SAM-dependent methyltransferase